MPELPDLQVFSKNLTKKLTGKAVKKISIRNTKKIKQPESAFKKAIEKQTLSTIERVGKELHFTFSNDAVLGLHMMLKGQLYLFEKENEHKYPIIEILFDDDTGLVMTDFQGQATPTLNPEDKDAPDALSAEVNASFLKEILGKSKATIKSLLLDQHIIRGIGNAYADEILWKAGISPFSICNKIPVEKMKDLAKAIKDVLKDAEKSILRSHPDIISGEVRDFLSIHNAKKKQSPTGAVIQHTMMNARKTYYTEEQQVYV
jgi:formamidopyrimidine-DNA glycosylase